MANTKKYVSLDKLSLYDEKIKKVIADADAAALQSAKDYADGLAVNYDAAGSAGTAETNAKGYADELNTAMDNRVTLVIQNLNSTTTQASSAMKKANEVGAEVEAHRNYVGTIPSSSGVSTVIAYIDKKTEGIATDAALGELQATVTQAVNDIDAIEADYLKAADKTALEGQISGVQTAVDTEKSRAEGIEAGLRTDIDTVMGDYLKAADKTELQGNIDTLTGVVETLSNGVDPDKVDGVKDLIAYVDEHGATVTGLQDGIDANAEAIEGVAGRMTTAEGKITAVEGAVATKAEKTYVDEQVQALQGVDTGLDNRLKAIEGKFGGAEGSIEDQIADAQAAAIAAAAADATSKANAAETAAKGHADSLNTAMNTRVEALEAIDHDHSNKSELDLIASGDKAKWDEAYTKRHEHSNLTVLEGITSAKVTAWDAAEGNAKTYADGLNTAMNTRVEALELWHTNFTEVSEEEINALFA